MVKSSKLATYSDNLIILKKKFLNDRYGCYLVDCGWNKIIGLI